MNKKDKNKQSRKLSCVVHYGNQKFNSTIKKLSETNQRRILEAKRKRIVSMKHSAT